MVNGYDLDFRKYYCWLTVRLFQNLILALDFLFVILIIIYFQEFLSTCKKLGLGPDYSL